MRDGLSDLNQHVAILRRLYINESAVIILRHYCPYIFPRRILNKIANQLGYQHASQV